MHCKRLLILWSNIVEPISEKKKLAKNMFNMIKHPPSTSLYLIQDKIICFTPLIYKFNPGFRLSLTISQQCINSMIALTSMDGRALCPV